MSFACAVFALMRGHKVKRHHWTGYWHFDKDKETVIMHMHDGREQDIRETKDILYTLSNCAADDWDILTTYAVDFPGGTRYYRY
jgi:hypothetical protein